MQSRAWSAADTCPHPDYCWGEQHCKIRAGLSFSSKCRKTCYLLLSFFFLRSLRNIGTPHWAALCFCAEQILDESFLVIPNEQSAERIGAEIFTRISTLLFINLLKICPSALIGAMLPSQSSTQPFDCTPHRRSILCTYTVKHSLL